MKKTRNGITIEIRTSLFSNSGSLTITHDGVSDKVSLGMNAAIALNKFLSDPEPEVDTREFHYETFDNADPTRKTGNSL